MATDYPELTKARLRNLLTQHLAPGSYSERTPVQVEASKAAEGPFEPFSPGGAWGSPWSTTWFRISGGVPEPWRGRRAFLSVDLGFRGQTGFTCEAQAWRDGRPWRGVDPNHRLLPLAEGPFEVLLEAAANPTATIGGPGRAQSMLAARESTRPRFRLGPVELVLEEPEVRALCLDFKTLLELALALPAGDPRGLVLLADLNRCANALRLDDLAATAAAGRAELAAALGRRNGGGAHRVTAVGHAHLDTAWLWPLQEAQRKVVRTFSTAVELLEEYPDHRFAASQAAQYAWVKARHPELFERIRGFVAEGRWEVAGGMWVEPDCNLPDGESLVRQLLHGKRFFQRELGADSTICWQPDVFGYPASLPQIIAGAGCTRFTTQKLSWNQFNQLPHHTFWWEGIDGTRVLTHCPPTDTYNGSFEVGQLLDGVTRFRDHGRSARSLYLYGWGDGGGGPEPDMVEAARRLAALDGAPRVELGTATAFFDAVEAEEPELATWSGELYFELHRGTYTTQSRLKRLHRQAEQALRGAELWSVAAGGDYPRGELESAWQTLLLNQFHDILPGSSIDWVYQDAERDVTGVLESAGRLAAGAVQRVAGRGDTELAFNAAGHPRTEVVQDAGGLVRVEVPACGFAPVTGPRDGGARAGDGFLENELLRLEWDEEGCLTRVFDKEAGRDVLAPGERGNVLQLHPDHPLLWDAWDLDAPYQEQLEVIGGLEAVEIAQAGGLRAAARFRRRFGASEVVQDMVLDSGSRVVRFATDVDWHEEHRVLKVAFPVAVRSPHATYEIQFGHVERPTHRNTSWDVARFEVPAQRWADLGEAGYGVALLNDCKYGYDVLGSVMRLTLLRAPTHPDPTADRGRHRFTYALMPHPGDFRTAGVIAAAEDLNCPLTLTRGAPAAARSFFEVDSPQIAIAAVKRSEDGDAVIVRLYEAWGGRCDARLRTALPLRRACLTDLLEQELSELVVDGQSVPLRFDPFKILTVKLEA